MQKKINVIYREVKQRTKNYIIKFLWQSDLSLQTAIQYQEGGGGGRRRQARKRGTEWQVKSRAEGKEFKQI